MTKMLLVLSLVCLGILAIGTTLFAQNPAFWLASGASVYQYARIALMFVIVWQLTTRPPRHMLLRILSGVLAAAVGAWALKATYVNQMGFLDTMSLLSAAIAIGVTALEPRKRFAEDVVHSSKNTTYVVTV